jgi:CRP-like cAMP-binding protein
MDSPLITYLQLFRGLPEEDKGLLTDAFEPRCLKEGDTLFRGGSICREMFFVSKGVLRILATNAKGQDVTHYFLGENQFCTILHSFNNGVIAEETIQAACDAEVLAISRAKLLALYEKIPYLQALIDQITQQRLLDKIQIRNAYLGQDALTRYKLFMMRQPDIALRVSLKDIASYLEITPQSLSRIRKSMM